MHQDPVVDFYLLTCAAPQPTRPELPALRQLAWRVN